jgi:hypothetical protein
MQTQSPVRTRTSRIPVVLQEDFHHFPPAEQLDTIALLPWVVAENREEARKRIVAPDSSPTKVQCASAFTYFINIITETDILVYTDGSKLQNGNAGAGYAISQSLLLSRRTGFSWLILVSSYLLRHSTHKASINLSSRVNVLQVSQSTTSSISPGHLCSQHFRKGMC